MIISASRRTDIPAFFMHWFMNRVREGVVHTRNPFNPHQITKLLLTPDNTDAIVFWTRDARNLLPHLSELDRYGFRYYVQYTLTGYPKVLEPHVPSLETSLDTFCSLSEALGKTRVIWRYDPVLITSLTPIAEHKRLFELIAERLSEQTKRVVISFADFYIKTQRRLKSIAALSYAETLSCSELEELCAFFAECASSHGLEISSCSEPLLEGKTGIQKGACVDAALLKEAFGIEIKPVKDRNQRAHCGCIRSIDIGVYNTCAFDCLYCYATTSSEVAIKNRKNHNPDSCFLLGNM